MLIRLFLSTLAVVITAYLLPGVAITSFVSAILVAAILAFLNTVIKPLLVIFTLPITIFTFGLFLLIITAFMVYIVHSIVPGFSVEGFWWAIAFSFILSLTTTVLERLVQKRESQA